MAAANQKKFIRINEQIRAGVVRVVMDNQPIGVMGTEEARRKAFDLGLDLVEIAPNAKPPVCHILDYGKYKYEQKIHQKEDRKKQRSIASKEIQFRYCIGPHDLETKVAHIKKFLEEKRQVRLIVKFKNRELAFKKQGEELIKQIGTMVEEVGTLLPPKLEGKNMIAQVNPK
jgi:translation initiation factor IF-3